ncbi:MAG: FAD/NAD(P)-binding protein [Myxococcota bacterium]
MALDLDWLILGGGIHGTLVSHFLTATGQGVRDRLRVLDPHEHPMAVWRHCARSVGMRYMRSPSVHHIDLKPWSMRAFANERKIKARGFASPYHRPRLDVFEAHCDWVIERDDLRALRCRGTATGLRRGPAGEGWSVSTDAGELRSRRVVLAMGSMHALAWPRWARALNGTGRVEHVLEPGFSRSDLALTDDVAVVGGAISAAQLALCLAGTRGRSGRVVVLARREPWIRQFDTDPGWLGPRYLTGFAREPCMQERRRLIGQARGGGTISPEEWRRVRRAIRADSLEWRHDEVVSAQIHPPHHQIELGLRAGGVLRVDRVVLATGFDRGRPLAPWLEQVAREQELSRAPCGAPILTPDLQWGPGLFVTGPGAELQLGPVARNVSGARMAAQRLVAAV